MYEHLSFEYGIVAVVALKTEQVGKFGVHGTNAGARLAHLSSVIALRVAVVNAAECAVATVEQALCAHLVVRHGIDEVLYLRTVVKHKLLAVWVVQIEQTATDDVVAVLHAFVQLVVLCCGSVILGNVAAGIHSPVYIQLDEQRFSHPFVRLAVGGSVVLVREVRQAFLHLFLYKLSHLLTRAAHHSLIVSGQMVQHGHVAVAVHKYEVIEGTHQAGRSCHLWSLLKFFYNLVTLCDAACQVGPIACRIVA